MDFLRTKEEYKKDFEYKKIMEFINKYPNITIQSEAENEQIFNIGRELDRIEARLKLYVILK